MAMMKRYRKSNMIMLCIAAALFLMSPLFPYIRSLVVMSVYSRTCEQESIMKEENIELKIPGGGATSESDWYPFVMTFTADDAFARQTGRAGEKLTILYNFPAFDLAKGCSRLYDEKSLYYNGFYGAYLVQQADGSPYGFDEAGDLNEEAAAQVAEFDFFTLVLGDFGLPESAESFECNISDTKSDITFVGYDGWTRIEAGMLVNGAAHEEQQWVQSYLQYGAPNYKTEKPFALVEMKSIVYARYFEEWNSSIFFYVMAPDEDVCRKCEKEILAQSILN